MEYKLASLSKRFVALFIDATIVSALTKLAFFLLDSVLTCSAMDLTSGMLLNFQE